MFEIVHTIRGNDVDVLYIRSQVELHEGFNELFSGVRVLRLTSDDGLHTHQVRISVNSRITAEEFVSVATLFAQGNIAGALQQVEALKAKFVSGRVTRDLLG